MQLPQRHAHRSKRRIAAVSATALAGTAAIVGMAAATFSASADEQAAPVQDDEPIGYAGLNGGTTGGHGGGTVNEYVLSEYWPDSGAGSPGDALYELINEHGDADGDGLVVYIDETISADDFGESKLDVKDVENVSLLGVGESGEFDGVGINLARAHNIVIRNLTIHHVDTGDKDAIGIQSESSNIWIDHNELYNVYPDVDKDHYDGLIDVKDSSEYITVSWNHVHDSWKTMLTASSDSEDKAGDNITYAHNWFENVNSRVPLIRYSDVHMLNNYFQDVAETAINARMGAQVLVEGNYFESVGTGEVDDVTGDIHGPVGWFYGSDEPGQWNLVDNVYEDTPSEHLESTTDFTVPYAYDALSPDEAKSQATTETGVGVIDVNP